MKQVININFQGRVIPIEVTAYDLLKNYIDRLQTYFAKEEGKEEIINDIEDRFAELFDERIKKGSTCIVDDDVNAIIKNMGMPEDFEPGMAEEESTTGKTESTEAPDLTTLKPKRLYRDEKNKILGGVCSGIGKYLGVEPWVFRILLLVTGIGFLAYFILWAVLPSSSAVEIGSYRKKLFRDTEGKWIGGVASGLANYFGVSVWVPRILFAVPFLSYAFDNYEWGSVHNMFRVNFSPGTLLLYIILWLVIPEAKTKSEKMEMKGEKVDIDTIKNSVIEEMKDLGTRAKKMGQEGTEAVQNFGAKLGNEFTGERIKKGSNGLAYAIAFIFKIFGYFIVGCIAFAAILGLFSIAVIALQALPYKDLVINDGLQNVWAWGTLLFFIATPIIGIITWIVRRIAKMNGGSKTMRVAFVCLHVIGWLCAINLVVSIGRDFKYENALTQDVVLADPSVRSLEVKANPGSIGYYASSLFDDDSFEFYDNDSAVVRNVEVRLFKAADDNFKVTRMTIVASSQRRYTDSMLRNFNYSILQVDSTLQIDEGIKIDTYNKFRNQRVIVNVYVPVGKKIKVNRNANGSRNFFIDGPGQRGYRWRDDEDERSYHYATNVLYTMTADGLRTQDGRKVGDDDGDTKKRLRIDEDGIEYEEQTTAPNGDTRTYKYESNDENYRYNEEKKNNYNSTKDSLDQLLKQQQNKKRDSLLKVKEDAEKALNNISSVKAESDFPSALLVSNSYLLSFAN